MTEKGLNILYEKRVLTFWIDIVIFTFIFDYMFSNMILLPIYFYIFPLLNTGQTFGMMITKIRILFLEDINFFSKFLYLILRTLYALLTLYFFRMTTFATINSLGQLNFDKRFNVTIINVEDKISNQLNILDYRVNVHPMYFIKIFVVTCITIFLINISEIVLR